jgi:serine/threonine-protein kinase PRP4
LSRSPEPDDFSLAKAHEDDIPPSEPVANGEVEQVLAADYDPSLDRREDEQKRIRDGFPNTQPQQPEEEEVEEEVEEEELDDMFAIAMGEKKPKKVKKVVVSCLSKILYKFRTGLTRLSRSRKRKLLVLHSSLLRL